MKTAHEAIVAMKAKLEQRLEELNPKQGEFAGRPLRAINPRTFPRESEIEKMLAFLDTLEAEATPEKLVLKNELTGEVVVERTIPEHMRGADPEIACACMKLLSAGWTLIAPGFEDVDLEKELSGWMGFYAYENGGEYPSAIDIARHFFNLGLNSKK